MQQDCCNYYMMIIKQLGYKSQINDVLATRATICIDKMIMLSNDDYIMSTSKRTYMQSAVFITYSIEEDIEEDIIREIAHYNIKLLQFQMPLSDKKRYVNVSYYGIEE